MKNDTKLLALNEIAGAYILPQLSDEDMDLLRLNSASFLKARLGVETEASLSVVSNTEQEVHLALPYYDFVGGGSAMALSDDDLDAITGGEILISVCIACGFGIGAGIATAASASIGVGALVGSVTGGLIGATVLGTSVAAGVRNKAGKNIDGSKK